MKYAMAVILALLLLPASLNAAEGDYVIGDGDGLSISVWGEPTLSQSIMVRPDGKITLPALGDVIATGSTPQALSERLEEELTQYVKVPIVTVTVTGINNSKVYVFGGGPADGVHGLPGRTTLLKFLAGVGNMKAADLKRAYLMRDEKIIHRDFYDLYFRGDLAKDIEVKPNDIIYMPDKMESKIYMMGAVGSPNHYVYRENISILDAILEAGGFTEFAKKDNVVVLRNEEDGMKKYSVNVEEIMKEGNLDENFVLKEGDFVVVKESIF